MTKLNQAKVTCHTDGCDNTGIPILLSVPDDTTYMCGVCGQEITDIEAA